ncbi:VC0807 family protein [Actinokineospora auranticolor]|nr:VC0807 family protein [Actinokineospora auranticolor]
MLPLLLIDVVLPAGVYLALHLLGVSDLIAIAAAGSTSLLRVLFTAIHTKRLDGLAAFILLLFAAAVIAALLVGDPRVAIAKDSAFTAAFAVGCYCSLLFGRPVAYHLARRFLGKPSLWDAAWRRNPVLRRKARTMTAVCATLFLVDAIARIPVVYSMGLSTSEAEVASRFIALGLAVALAVVGRTQGRGLRKEIRPLEGP